MYTYSLYEWFQIKPLKPVKEGTIQLQRLNMTLGEFYGCWMRIKFKLELIDSPLSNSIIRSMEVRETNLLDKNPLILAGIF